MACRPPEGLRLRLSQSGVESVRCNLPKINGIGASPASWTLRMVAKEPDQADRADLEVAQLVNELGDLPYTRHDGT